MKSVAIVGSHSATRDNAPWDDTSLDIWVFNEAAMKDWVKRCTGVFQMHVPAVYRSRYNRSDRGHWEWLQRKHDYPVWMIEIDPLVPDSVKYPLEDLMDTLKCERYFETGIAYAMALAAYQGYEKVLMYGVEMKSQTEYYYQRNCIRYWVGFLQGWGVKIEWYCADDLFDSPLYGYEGNLAQDTGALLNRKIELEKEVRKLKLERAELEVKLDEVLAAYGDPVEAMAALSDNVNLLGKHEGMLYEVNKYWEMAVDLEMEHGAAYFDRQRFEIDSAAQHKAIKEKNASTLRKAGRMDVSVTAFIQHKNSTAERQFRQYWKMYQDDNYELGYTQGMYDECSKMKTDMDRRIYAAGNSKAYEMMMEDYKRMEAENEY